MKDAERVPRRRGEPVREKILAAADALFYRDGVRAVGIDAIIAQSGVAKASFYRWYPSKDALIVAFLEGRNELFWAQWEKVARNYEARPREELHAHLDWLGRYVMDRTYRGCPFLNATAAFPDIDHPARAVCTQNKTRLHRELLALARAAHAHDPDLLADQLTLLIEGALANAPVLGERGPARALPAAGRALIDAASA